MFDGVTAVFTHALYALFFISCIFSVPFPAVTIYGINSTIPLRHQMHKTKACVTDVPTHMHHKTQSTTCFTQTWPIKRAGLCKKKKNLSTSKLHNKSKSNHVQ